MIRCVSGNSVLRSRGLSDRISYRMDTEISPPHPKSWSAGLFVVEQGVLERECSMVTWIFCNDSGHR